MSGEWQIAPDHAWERNPVDGITVSGGTRAVHFQWEELDRGEQLIRQLSGELHEVAFQVGTASRQLAPLIQPAAYTGMAAQARVEDAERSLRRCSDALAETAQRIAAARWRYEATEVLVLGGFETRIPGVGPFDGLLINEVRPMRNDLEPLMQILSPATEALVRQLQRDGNLRSAPISVREVNHGSQVPVAANFEWLLQRSRDIDAAGSGLLEVIEVENGPGRRPTFVVSYPGTQPGGFEATENPFDETGLAESMTAESEYVTQAVGDALRQAGAEAGDPVILSGYSQGGIHAANAAGNEAVGGLYDVKMVLTAGSPVGTIDVPDQVQAVQLEHLQDWVPGSDGARNPDDRNRVTVNLHDRVSTDDGDVGLGPAHDIDSYVAGARKADASDDPALLAASGALGTALMGDKGRRHVFRLRREPRPKRREVPVTVQPGPKF